MSRVRSDLTCRELEEFIHDYMEGGLSASERERFESHLRDCSACRAYLEAYKTTVQLGKAAYRNAGALNPDEVPDDLITAIVDTLKGRAPGEGQE